MAAHSLFSPSAASRWMACPASVALTRNAPKGSNRFADEGTCAHDLAQRALTYQKPASFWIGETVEINNVVWTFTKEMADYVQVYVDYVMQLVGGGTLLIEQRVRFDDTIGVEDQSGTADAIVLSEDGERISIVDLKYGLGVRVECRENKQLMTYACGVLETFGPVLDLDNVKEVAQCVVQPRLDHIDEWVATRERLTEHAKSLHTAARLALDACAAVDNGVELSPGYYGPTEDACRWCAAKATCPALRQKISDAVYGDFEVLEDPEAAVVSREPVKAAGPTIGSLYGVLDLVEDWCRGIRAEVERMVLGGMDVIGPDGQRMKVVEGRKGHRSWTDPEQAAAVLETLKGPEAAYRPREVVTPAVADKLFKKAERAMWDDALAPLTTQAPGRPSVVLGSDPRPPFTGTAGASEFDEVPQ